MAGLSGCRRWPSRRGRWWRRRRWRVRSRPTCPSTAFRRRPPPASFASSAKCGPGFSSTGGMHIRPSMARPCTARQRSTKATASRGLDAGLLRFRAGIDLDVEPRRLALPGRSPWPARRRSFRGRRSRCTSNSATASFALLDCSGPIRCSSMSGNSLLQRRPFALRFLHAVLAEDALAGLDDRTDVGGARRSSRRRPASPRPDRASPRRPPRRSPHGRSGAVRLPCSCLSRNRYNACRQPQS